MMILEKLLHEAKCSCIEVYEESMPKRIKGLYGENVIWLNKNMHTNDEKACILAEELGHHYTSAGNILHQARLENRKQERKARVWAYKRLIPLSSFITAYKAGIRSCHELAEYLNITEKFLNSAIQYYKEKHGSYITVDNYIINFEPVIIMEMFNERR